MKLYSHPQSGHAHRVELLLSILKIDYELHDVDLAAGEQRSAAFLALNPWGQIPVLVDGELVLSEANAILVYLARQHDAVNWLPQDATRLALVEGWLSRAAGPLAYGLATARTIVRFQQRGDLKFAARQADKLLFNMDTHLSRSAFLIGNEPTICDLSLYSYTAVAPEAGIDLDRFPHVMKWIHRIEALDGFVPLRRITNTT